MSVPALTVVVPTLERRALLHQLLSALTHQTLRADRFEVVVIVDGSTDGTSDMLAAFTSAYRLTWTWQPNAGRAAACNAGIALARGALVVLLDDDMEPTPMLLEAHLNAHRAGTRRAVMGAAPVVIAANASRAAHYVGRKFNRHLAKLATPGRRFGLRNFYSGNLSVPRAVLAEVGGFDEDFKAYGNEDLELSWRLRNAGVEIAFSAEAVACQHYVKDFAALARDNVGKGRTAVLLATKHPGTLSELAIGATRGGSVPRRCMLRLLLTLTRVWPATSGAVVRLMSAIERLGAPGLDRAYRFVLDYHYQLGAMAARGRGDGGP